MPRLTHRRSAPDPSGPPESSPTSGGVSDFDRLMSRVGATILAHWNEVHAETVRDPTSNLEEAQRILAEALAHETQPITRANQRERDKTLELIHRIEGLMRGAEVPGTHAQAVFNPWVFYLLTLNYSQLRLASKVREAKADLRDFVKSLTKESKGRPPKISPTELREIKELRDQGWSYGRLARKFGRSAEKVRLTLKYHYPGEKAK